MISPFFFLRHFVQQGFSDFLGRLPLGRSMLDPRRVHIVRCEDFFNFFRVGGWGTIFFHCQALMICIFSLWTGGYVGCVRKRGDFVTALMPHVLTQVRKVMGDALLWWVKGGPCCREAAFQSSKIGLFSEIAFWLLLWTPPITELGARPLGPIFGPGGGSVYSATMLFACKAKIAFLHRNRWLGYLGTAR